MLSTISTRRFLSVSCRRRLGSSVYGWSILTPGTSLSTRLSSAVWRARSGSRCRCHAPIAPALLCHDPKRGMLMQAAVHRLSAAGPSDTAMLDDAIARGLIRPETIVAVLGKTEGNGAVNDFTRGFATASFRACLARHLGVSAAAVEARV